MSTKRIDKLEYELDQVETTGWFQGLKDFLHDITIPYFEWKPFSFLESSEELIERHKKSLTNVLDKNFPDINNEKHLAKIIYHEVSKKNIGDLNDELNKQNPSVRLRVKSANDQNGDFVLTEDEIEVSAYYRDNLNKTIPTTDEMNNILSRLNHKMQNNSKIADRDYPEFRKDYTSIIKEHSIYNSLKSQIDNVNMSNVKTTGSNLLYKNLDVTLIIPN